MLTKSRVIQLCVMLCLLIGLFVWRTIDLSNVENENSIQNTATLNTEDDFCDFSIPCPFDSIFGTFYLSVDEGKINPEEWFHLRLKSQLDNWSVSSAKIVGKTMFMGKIPISFSPVILNDEQLETKAKTMVGVCTEEKMIWRIEIIVDINEQPVNLYYDFLISH